MCSGGLSGKTYSTNMIPYSSDAINELILQCSCRNIVSKKRYLNIPAAFDTETTSFIDDDDGEESALCYIWMFGIDECVVYGRHLEEFVDCIQKVNSFLDTIDAKLVVYIHFAKFDFSFIKYLFDWNKVFMKENREVLFADYRNIEFRDSLVLSGGQGLAKIGEKLREPVHKAVGDMDYDLIRHSRTPLTEQELHYCEMDIRVLCEYIREKIQDDGDISKIPYTNTGYVRNYVRNECFRHRYQYMDFISYLTMTPDCYVQAESAFTGGSVAPNIKYVGKECKGVHSYDIKSSYPYVMCTAYYPMRYFTPVPKMYENKLSLSGKTELQSYLNKYCCLMTLELWDVEPRYNFYFPISKHKCLESVGVISSDDKVYSASGRIINALYLRLDCTELDLKTIFRFYKVGKWRIGRLRIAPRGYLPSPIIRSVLKFFHDKTTLDGVEGYEREYMIAKNMLNAVYGMMVEKPVRPVWGFVNYTGFIKQDADFVEQIDSYNEKFNRFLFYPWGVWVTAHARYRLHDAILHVGEDFRYCDTDSVKFVGNHDAYFKEVNKQARAEMQALAQRERLALDYVIPKSPDGVPKCLGVWEHEWDAYTFKTLGCKRYLVDYSWTEKSNRNYKPGEKIGLTVAGSNKEDTLKYFKKQSSLTGKTIFELFNSDCAIPKEYAGRTISKFIDHERTGWITDYLGNRAYYESPSGLFVKSTTYSFSITDEMKDAVIWLSHDGYYQDGQI